MPSKRSNPELPKGLEILVQSEVCLQSLFFQADGAPSGLLYAEREAGRGSVKYLIGPSDGRMLLVQFTRNRIAVPGHPVACPRYKLVNMDPISFVGELLGPLRYGPALSMQFCRDTARGTSGPFNFEIHPRRGTLPGEEKDYQYLSRAEFVDAAGRLIEKIRPRKSRG